MVKMRKKFKYPSSKYFRLVFYFFFFKFGLALIVLPFMFISQYAKEMVGVDGLVLSFIMSIYGIFAAVHLRKRKLWAVNSVLVIELISLVSKMITFAALGRFKIPHLEIASIAFLIGCYRYLKNDQ